MPLTHYLPANRSCAIPGQVVVVDTETIRTQGQPEHAVAIDKLRLWSGVAWRNERDVQTRRTTCEGDTGISWWEWLDDLCSPNRVTWIFAHSIGYDLQQLGLWNRIDHGFFDIRTTATERDECSSIATRKAQRPIVCIDDPPFILQCYRATDQATLRFIDTVNYWPMSLREIGESIGVAKYTMPDTSATDEEWYRYCARDCEVVEVALLRWWKFIRENDLGMARYTMAGQSMAAFRHKYMKHKIVVHQEPECRALERCGYYGGQTECYRVGLHYGPVYHLDVSSFYPNVMLEREFPVRRICYEDACDRPARIAPCIPIERSIATVTVAAEQRTYPVRDDGKVKYAVGTFTTTLCGPELYDAYCRGEILLWHKWAAYETAPVFKEFIEELWELRKHYGATGDTWAAQSCKGLMNSLYGKFGQRAPVWQEIVGKYGCKRWGKSYIADRVRGEFRWIRHIAGVMQENVGKKEHSEAVPSIAAFVTAYGREKMRGLREAADPGHVLFQCTDSLLTTQLGYDNLVRQGLVQTRELGYLRLIGKYNQVDIRGCNFYRRDNEWVCAGVDCRVVEVTGETWTVQTRERTGSIVETEPHDGVKTVKRVHTVRPGEAWHRRDLLGNVLPHLMLPNYEALANVCKDAQ